VTVPNCSPPLPTLSDMVRQLNADREFFGFIKRGQWACLLVICWKIAYPPEIR
jgi:hypothetical protein